MRWVGWVRGFGLVVEMVRFAVVGWGGGGAAVIAAGCAFLLLDGLAA